MSELFLPLLCDLPHEAWPDLQRRVERLERAWESHPEPRWTEFLGGSPAAFHVVAVELIKVDQENRWRRGTPRLLEEYLAECPRLPANPRVLADLLQGEWETRRLFGDVPDWDELCRRFPELSAETRFERSFREGCVEFSGRRSDSARGADRSALDTVDNGEEALATIPFGRYVIDEPLGRGAMGIVYRAFDTHLRRHVALKVPRNSTGGSLNGEGAAVFPAGIRRQFEREAQSLAAVRHPNVCTIHDHGAVDGQPFLTMELLEGVRLDEWISRHHPVDQWQAAQVILGLACALEAMHEAGVLHRDVKSANVVLVRGRGAESPEGQTQSERKPPVRPILTDFSVVKNGAQSTDAPSETGIAGTPAFMSPEQADGRPIDARSDIYSLGVVFYQLLTGRLPFQGTVREVLENVRTSGIPAVNRCRPTVDSRLSAICMKSLQRRAVDRFQSAAELVSALQGAIQTHQRSILRRRVGRWVSLAVLLTCGAIAMLGLPFGAGRNGVDRGAAAPPQVGETGSRNLVLRGIEAAVKDGLPEEPLHPRNIAIRTELVHLLRKLPGSREAATAARLMTAVAWPPVDASEPEAIWWDRRRDAGPAVGPLVDLSRTATQKLLLVRGRIAAPGDISDRFAIRGAKGRSYIVQLVSITPGFRPIIHIRWQSPVGGRGNSLAVSRDGSGVGVEMVAPEFASGDRRIAFEVAAAASSTKESGEFLFALVQIEVGQDERYSRVEHWSRRLHEIAATRRGGRSATGDVGRSAPQRRALLRILREARQSPEATTGARLLAELPWPEDMIPADHQVWIRDAYPGGPTPSALSAPMSPGDEMVVCGSIRSIGKGVSLSIPVTGVRRVTTQLYSLTPGFCPFMIQEWPRSPSVVGKKAVGTSDSSAVTPTMPACAVIDGLPPGGNNRVTIAITQDAAYAASGRFLLYIRLPRSATSR